MPNQKTFTPNSILDVKQYIFCDSNDGLVLSNPRFVKIFKSCQKALKSFDLSFKKDVPYFKSNLSLIMEIPLNFLMKIVLDYIRSSHVKIVPMEFVNMIKENDALFYETFNRMEIYSFYELLSFLFLLKYNSANFQNTFFKCILKKLESLLMNKFIHIKIDDLKLFYSHLSKKQISEVLLLLIKIKENLVFVSEFDLQVRYEKYLIDIGKYDKLTELIEFSLSFK